MPVTRATLLTEIRDNLNELTAHQWSEDQLRRWINEGGREVGRRVLSHEETDTIATVADQEEYTLPADIIQLYRVEYFEDANDFVSVLELRDFNEMDTIGWASHQFINSYHPCVASVWGYAPAAKLIVFPKPDITGATIKFYYYKIPTELPIAAGSDSLAIDIPEGWYDILKDYVEYRAFRKQRDPRWQESKQLYEQKIMEMNQRTMRHHNQSGRVVFDNHGWYDYG